VTLLLHRRLLRGVRRSRQHDERKHQQDHPHLSLQKVSALAGARLWAFMPHPRHRQCEGRHTATPIPLCRPSSALSPFSRWREHMLFRCSTNSRHSDWYGISGRSTPEWRKIAAQFGASGSSRAET
jgi:hypothetical protein